MYVTVCIGLCSHTMGHICYSFGESTETSVMTGDTLFIGGCGKFFEGGAQEAHHSLMGILAKLPGYTKVWCGHEYTVSNLKFAQSLEPENRVITQKMKWAVKQLEEGKYTVPSTIQEEMFYNPFLRVGEMYIQEACGTENQVDTLAAVRQMKDNFKPK